VQALRRHHCGLLWAVIDIAAARIARRATVLLVVASTCATPVLTHSLAPGMAAYVGLGVPLPSGVMRKPDMEANA